MELTKSEVVKVRVRPAMLAQLQEAAYHQEMRLSELIRLALDEYLQRGQTDESD